MNSIMVTDEKRGCLNCGHRIGEGEFAECAVAGNYCTLERRYNSRCNARFSAWIPIGISHVRTCKTCKNNSIGICGLSGFNIITERHNPEKCGRNFENWVERPKKKSFFFKIIKLFTIKIL